MAERHVKEELQSGDGRVERDRRDAVIDQVQLVAPQILAGAYLYVPSREQMPAKVRALMDFLLEKRELLRVTNT